VAIAMRGLFPATGAEADIAQDPPTMRRAYPLILA
jgi:hypothetical protein